MPIAGQSLVGRIIRGLARQEVRDLVLNLHYLPETVTARVGDGGEFGARVRYSWESPILGSAGGPRKALALLPPEDFFIVNGDTLCDVDLHALEAHHRQSGALVTMAVINDRSLVERYGGVVTDSAGIIHGFVPRGPAAVGYHFVGVQIVRPSAFESLAPDQPAESTRGLYRTLIAERPGSVRAFLSTADFRDVGTPSDYLAAALLVSKAEGHALPPAGARSQIHGTAQLVDSVIWDDVRVGAGASLTRCIVADGVTIPAGARFMNCAIVQRDGHLVVADLPNG